MLTEQGADAERQLLYGSAVAKLRQHIPARSPLEQAFGVWWYDRKFPWNSCVSAGKLKSSAVPLNLSWWVSRWSAFLVPLLPGFTVKALEPSLLDAPFCAFYSREDRIAAGTGGPVRKKKSPALAVLITWTWSLPGGRHKES